MALPWSGARGVGALVWATRALAAGAAACAGADAGHGAAVTNAKWREKANAASGRIAADIRDTRQLAENRSTPVNPILPFGGSTPRH